MTQALRSKIDKWYLIKLQIFCKAKDMVNRIKWQHTDWEKIFINPISNRELISKLHKEDVRIPKLHLLNSLKEAQS